jgi:hypothetical protein
MTFDQKTAEFLLALHRKPWGPPAAQHPCKKGEWQIDGQWIRNHLGNAICQWASYTDRKNANLMVLAKRHEKALAILEAARKCGRKVEFSLSPHQNNPKALP